MLRRETRLKIATFPKTALLIVAPFSAPKLYPMCSTFALPSGGHELLWHASHDLLPPCDGGASPLSLHEPRGAIVLHHGEPWALQVFDETMLGVDVRSTASHEHDSSMLLGLIVSYLPFLP